MDPQPQLVIVANTPALTRDLVGWLDSDYQAIVATTFSSAKAQLRTHPHLVITQVKLHEYNGLHIALRARCEGIPAVVVGESDAVLERDAERIGAAFVNINELTRERILALLHDLIPSACGDHHEDKNATWIGCPGGTPC